MSHGMYRSVNALENVCEGDLSGLVYVFMIQFLEP